jgi:hypothetical protein
MAPGISPMPLSAAGSGREDGHVQGTPPVENSNRCSMLIWRGSEPQMDWQCLDGPARPSNTPGPRYSIP